MSDEGLFERDCDALAMWREAEDSGKFRFGLRAARMSLKHGQSINRYGESNMDTAARMAGVSPQTLYARRDVAIFICQISRIFRKDTRKFSPGRFFEDNPEITYTHLRITMPKSDWDIESAIESLMAISYGNPEFEKWLRKQEDREIILPMTCRQFGQYVSWLRGGKPRPKPIFKARGRPLEVLRAAWNVVREYGMRNGGRDVEVTVREPR